MIELKAAIRQIDKMDFRDTRESFSIVFLKCNRDKRTGGELVHLTSANKCGVPPNCEKHEIRGIKCNETGKRYAVHDRLIFQFNDEVIYWI